jgi:hypothetical protein
LHFGVAVREAFASRRRQLLVLAPVFALAILASVRVAIVTADNVESGADSAVYLGTANEIRSWHGPTVPSTYWADVYEPHTALGFRGHVPSSHFPPGYPLTLAVVSAATGGTRSAARVVDIACIFVNVVLIGVLTARMTAYRSAFVAALPVVLTVFVPDQTLLEDAGWLRTHIGILSEPLFMVFATGALLAACTAVGPASRAGRATVVAGALASAAMFTRYVGVAAVFTVAVAIALLALHDRIGARAVRAVIVGICALLPTYLFLFWTAARGTRTSRLFAYHPIGKGALIEHLGRFFFPLGWPSALRTAGLTIIAVGVVASLKWSTPRVREFWRDDNRGRAQQIIVLLFIALYIVVVYFTRTFLDVNTPFDARLLAPIRALSYAAVVAVAYRWLAPYARAWVTAALLGILIAGLVYADWETERYWLDFGVEVKHVASTTEQALAALPPDAIIVTNAPEIVYLATGRRSLILPQQFVFLTRKPNPAFELELMEWARLLATRNGYAFFVATPLVFGIAKPENLARYTPLELLAESAGQSLYKVLPPRP